MRDVESKMMCRFELQGDQNLKGESGKQKVVDEVKTKFVIHINTF